MTVKLYVEGGGDRNKTLNTQCRQGFSKFLEKAGLQGRMPSVVACGGRQQAYNDFRTAHETAEDDHYPILLVDSEAPVTAASPWDHVKQRQADGWDRPPRASEDQLHLMVQAMEAWFHADRTAVEAYYGRGFKPDQLARRADIDHIPKTALFAGLKQASEDCKKGSYSKGEHSFQILARIDPAKVRIASPTHAGRFLNVLDRVCQRDR